MDGPSVTARVTGEHYRVVVDVGAGRPGREGPFERISDAVRRAMEIALERGVGCAVERVTTHEPVPPPWWIGEPVTETVTGRVAIAGPRSYDHDPALSRYHPVNGWVVPDTVEVPT